jgi:putative tricarboxylic transport membrane protein
VRRADPPGVAGDAAGRRPPLGGRISSDRLPAGAEGAQSATPAVTAPPRTAAEKPASRSMRVADIVTASLLVGLGVLVLVAAVKMGIGWGSDGPESGFVPFWLSTVLVVSCTAILVQAVRRASEKRFVSREQLTRVLKVLLPAVAMIVLTQFVGLYVASALYMGAFMRWGGRHSWTFSVALPLSVLLLIFFVFERWFVVPLPKGPLETWLGY